LPAAAYSTLLRGPRQAFHRRLAIALEARFPSVLEARPELAAHHYGAAAMADKAVPYWLLAGKLSAARSAVEEAVALLRRGLGLLQSLPETLERRLELDLHIPLISALQGARGYAHAELSAALEPLSAARRRHRGNRNAASLLDPVRSLGGRPQQRETSTGRWNRHSNFSRWRRRSALWRRA
jgi:predicted ATPase